MFIRQTATRNKSTSESYFTYRLVRSERVGRQVRQVTLLNLGRNFDLPRDEWPRLCLRIEALLSGQSMLLAESPVIEIHAQRLTARLIASRPAILASGAKAATVDQAGACVYAEVAVDSIELTRPRAVGIEHAGLSAMTWLGIDEVLLGLGLNGVQRAAVAGSVIGRMAGVGSELSTWRWLRERSALGELLDVDFESFPLMRLYRASDLLVRHRDKIEDALFGRLQTLFGFSTTVTLFDLTNTYFEGNVAGNENARRGHSKEKRTDCPLVTMGLVLDGSGFIRRSKMFAGNVVEATTLAGMLSGLGAPDGAMVIMDRGIATEKNITWLKQKGYRYLVVSRERKRQFDSERAIETMTASDETIRLQRVMSEDGQEVRLHCHSDGRERKETGIVDRFSKRFEAGLAKLAEGLTKPRGVKRLDKLNERIGKLKATSMGIGQHYSITLTPDKKGGNATAMTWVRTPVEGSMLTHPGVYCLRTNETTWDETTLWHTYTMLTDLESVFRALKSDLGLRPVFHHKQERTDGHLFITVLAYQVVQTIRQKLKEGQSDGDCPSWARLREILSVQQRVTASFRQRDGRTLHVRKATAAEPELSATYEALG
ncbi:MAG: IS1634 family transposase, partial [Acidobacteriota bacterium]